MREFSDVLSSTDFGSCSLLPFRINMSEGTSPVASKPYQIDPILVKRVDAKLDGYLATGLIEHSTSPFASPLVVVSKKSGGTRVTVNYKKVNKLSVLGQLPVPCTDAVVESLGKGRRFSLINLPASSHQITVNEDIVPLTAFCAPRYLLHWLRMPQGCTASPG